MKSLSEKITEASDPCTDPDTLRELSELSNKKLHRALALNPNTPEQVLRNLWTRHPDLILENPILALWETYGLDKTGSAVFGWSSVWSLRIRA